MEKRERENEDGRERERESPLCASSPFPSHLTPTLTTSLRTSPSLSSLLPQVQYIKNHPQSWTGQRLVPEGALHIGMPVLRFLSAKMASADGANRNALLLCTSSGALALVAPIADAKAHARLAAVQRLLPLKVPTAAGLNPRAFRRR
jgi:hypothetical protein